MFALLLSLLRLAGVLSEYMRDKRLIEGVEAQVIKDNLHDTLKKIERARIARSGVSGSMSDDPQNRDNN